MAPRTDWSVDVAVVLARIDSMDPGGAAADAAEIARIMHAAERIAMTLLSRFDTLDGLAGEGAVASDRAGAQLGADVGAAADRLAPAQSALTAAAGDLAASTALRPNLVSNYVAGGGTPLQAAVLRAAIAGTMNAVYSDPMSGRADGLPTAEASGRRAGGPAAVVGGVPVTPAATSHPPGTAPVSGPDAIQAGPAAVSAPRSPAPRGPTTPREPAPSSGAPPASRPPPAPAGPSSSPEPGPGAGPLAPGPAGSSPAGAVPVRPLRSFPASPPARGLSDVAFGLAARTPASTPAPSASSTPSSTSTATAAGRGVPATGVNASPASAAAPGAAPSGRSGSSSAVPPGAGRSGAREDTERKRPDHLLSTREFARLIGPLPLAGPPVLGEDPQPEPEPVAPESSEDEDVDFTL